MSNIQKNTAHRNLKVCGDNTNHNALKRDLVGKQQPYPCKILLEQSGLAFFESIPYTEWEALSLIYQNIY